MQHVSCGLSVLDSKRQRPESGVFPLPSLFPIQLAGAFPYRFLFTDPPQFLPR